MAAGGGNDEVECVGPRSCAADKVTAGDADNEEIEDGGSLTFTSMMCSPGATDGSMSFFFSIKLALMDALGLTSLTSTTGASVCDFIKYV